MSTLKVGTIADTSGSNGSTPAAIANGIAKAWVNFNGTGTVAIRASYNVSSITDNGTGLYTVNFTTSLADTSYSVVLGSTSPVPFCGDDSVPRTTSLCQVRTADTTFALSDYSYVQVAVFR